MTTPGQVFNGITWENVAEDDRQTDNNKTSQQQLLRGKKSLPKSDNNNNNNESSSSSSIFINLTHFKDEERCAKTIHNLFTKAHNPLRVFLGLVEHNEKTNKTVQDCRDLYCSLYADGGKDRSRHPISCRYYTQIEHMAVFAKGAKGPTVSRALGRKLLGNQEFCMQLDSHSDLVQDWDDVVMDQWDLVGNEFAVISHKPADQLDLDRANQLNKVSRSCHVELNPAKLPMFSDPSLTKAKDLKAPLLMPGWSAGFSFAKCHLEETVPYDFFLPQIFQGEEFPRYARMWTRGYDVYTPTQNIVYHDYSQESTAGKWTDSGIQRKWSQERIKTLLQIHMPSKPTTPVDYANLNLYGLGKRRTIEQFVDFVGFDFRNSRSLPSTSCANPKYVSYDYESLSPLANMYTLDDDADTSEMDPLPIMPLRTKPVFPYDEGADYYETAKTIKPLNVQHPHDVLMKKIPKSLAKDAQIAQEVLHKVEHDIAQRAEGATMSVKVLVSLWVFGIVIWFIAFATKRSRSNSSGALRNRRKKLTNGNKHM